MPIRFRILKLFGSQIVALKDMHGKIRFSIKKKDPFGVYWAYVYPMTKVGHVILNEDGTCSGESSYIKKWIDV